MILLSSVLITVLAVGWNLVGAGVILLSSVLITVLAIGWNLVGAGVILIWSGGLSVLMFGLLKRFDILRLRPEVEESVSQEFTILSARIYENASLLTTFKVTLMCRKKRLFTQNIV